MPKKNDFIAVFDSGVGGISVLRHLVEQMPQENYLYYGDCANAPYGKRTTEQVRQLTIAAADMLLRRDVKALVVACNTATSAAINDLREKYPDTIIVGIEPALKPAADHFPQGKVGVLATPLTLSEEKFAHLAERFPSLQIMPIPLPELVELIETGASQEALEDYLMPRLTPYAGKLEAGVLGCTHFPLAMNAIRKILGRHTLILDGGHGTARETHRRLAEADLLSHGPGSVQIEVSGSDPAVAARCAALLEQ